MQITFAKTLQEPWKVQVKGTSKIQKVNTKKVQTKVSINTCAVEVFARYAAHSWAQGRTPWKGVYKNAQIPNLLHRGAPRGRQTVKKYVGEIAF